MGLAERFKNRLDNKDIFAKTSIEKQFNEQNIEFISKPIAKDATIDKLENAEQTEQVISKPFMAETNKFEDLEDEIINKIRKTPYWEDFSSIQKEKMISGYFDARIQNNKYSNIEYSKNDKNKFIEDILALSDNR